MHPFAHPYDGVGKLLETIINKVSAVPPEQVSISSHKHNIKRFGVLEQVIVKPESMQ